MAPAERASRPIIFLLGPPGAGKSTLGGRASRELGLGFIDLAATAATNPAAERCSDLERLRLLAADRAADVIELSWPLQHEREALALARRSGVTLLLWAHPEDMQARSGRRERLFTPVPRFETRGGFGRRGTGCREFRRLDRACDEILMLVDLPFEEAAEALADCIAEIREERDAAPAEREGLDRWVENWRKDHGACPRAGKILVDAMARYLEHVRAKGGSPRTMSAIRSDMDAAGHLVFMYDAPKGKRVLDYFDRPPWESTFERKFSDSLALVARYRRSMEGFARFLRESGELPNDDDG